VTQIGSAYGWYGALHLFFMGAASLLNHASQANSGASVAAQGMSSIQSNANGTKVIIGPVFTAQAAESLASLALRFGSSVATLLKFNADLEESSGVQPGQHICILPCKK
jgi:hypothetical protein